MVLVRLYLLQCGFFKNFPISDFIIHLAKNPLFIYLLCQSLSVNSTRFTEELVNYIPIH